MSAEPTLIPYGIEPGRGKTDVRGREYATGGPALSGVEAGPPGGGRGVVLALHGSGYSGRYWHAGGGESSLLLLGADLGFRVIAIDRPGYGHSIGLADTPAASLAGQAGLVGDVVRGLRNECPRTPLFLIGHSFGSVLAVRIAAREATGLVAGVDVSGLPVRMRPEVERALGTGTESFATTLHKAGARAALFFGPPSSYHAAMLEPPFRHRIPRVETIDGRAAPRALHAVAPDLRVPVQCTVAEFEKALVAGPEAVAEARALFTSSPRAVAHWQPQAGHNVSLHRAGRAYHLRALAFFEEVIAMNAAAASLEPAT